MSSGVVLLELVRQLRHRLDDFGDYDDAPEDDAWVEDDAGCLWKNKELVRYLNEAESQFTRINPIVDWTTDAITQVVIAANEETKKIDRRILYIHNVRLDGTETELTKSTLEDIRNRGTETASEPDYYTEDEDQQLLLVYPTPTQETTLRLQVGRLPKQPMKWDSRERDKPEIPGRHHFDLLDWAANLAYQKQDPDTQNNEKASFWFSAWTNKVGPMHSEAREERVMRQVSGAILRTKATYR